MLIYSTFYRCVLCLVLGRANTASDVENEDDSGDSDSEIVEQLQAQKEKELKKSVYSVLLDSE